MNGRERLKRQVFRRLEDIQFSLREPRCIVTLLDSYIGGGISDTEKLDAVEDMIGCLQRGLQSVSDMIESYELSLLPVDDVIATDATETTGGIV